MTLALGDSGFTDTGTSTPTTFTSGNDLHVSGVELFSLAIDNTAGAFSFTGLSSNGRLVVEGDDLTLTDGASLGGGTVNERIVVGNHLATGTNDIDIFGDTVLQGTADGTGTFGIYDGSLTLDLASGTFGALVEVYEDTAFTIISDMMGDLYIEGAVYVYGAFEGSVLFCEYGLRDLEIFSGGSVTSQVIIGGQGRENVEVSGTGTFHANIMDLWRGDDDFDIFSGGTASGDILLGVGADTVTLDGSFTGFLSTGQGDDSVVSDDPGASMTGLIALDAGNDSFDGTNGPDSVRGGAGDDWILGDGGRDVLRGDAGDDTLIGDRGIDRLFGGAGADEFWYMFDDASPTTILTETIVDFVAADDTLVFFETGQFIGGAAFTNTAGDVRFEVTGGVTRVEADANGDGIADFAVELDGVIPLTVADFLFV